MLEVVCRYLVQDLIKRLVIYALVVVGVTYCMWQGYEGITGWKAGMENIQNRNAQIEVKVWNGG